MITIRRVTAEDSCQIRDVNRLIAQMNTNRPEITQKELHDFLANPLNRFFGAFDGERMIGIRYTILRRGLGRWMSSAHDLVVDKSMRGHGIGRMLALHGIADLQLFCDEQGEAFRHYTTSNPTRVESNHLIRTQGLEQVAEAVGKHGTNMYIMEFKPNK